MTNLVGSYSIKNLIQSSEYLLGIIQSLKNEISKLEKIRDEVRIKQTEATNQGLLLKKMTDFMSNELSRLENSKIDNSEKSSMNISKNIEKLSDTETKLRILRGRLTKFLEEDNTFSLKESDKSLSIELKQYESFLLTLTTTLNEKIANLEKIVERVKAEQRESEQQKILLKDMIELFNIEMNDLEQTLREIKK